MKPGTFKLLRAGHRWAGLFFAPLIVLFALSGLLQTLKAEDWAPAWALDALYAIEDAHTDQHLRDDTALQKVAVIVVAIMAIALAGSTLVGVVMAYIMYPKRRVLMTAVLVLGVVVPAIVMLI